ncbi:transmembrane protein 192 isoform X2 [Scleropages formosus]|uniref:transmembrane protein 192 isoform X2 n=1 Tax=Scleropages formosus TaxID=113540 RepID=UPI0008785A74|nr:transmembrane protein 192 isoform X2 [Scleropages formosus]
MYVSSSHIIRRMEQRGRFPHTNNSSTEITQSMEDDPLFDGPLISTDALHSTIKKEFKNIPTAWVAILLLFIHVTFVCLSVALAVYCSILEDKDGQCHNYLHDFESGSVIVFAKVILWLLFVAFERFVQYHHSSARSRGYLQFYRTTRNLKRLPLLIHSVGSAAVLLILSTKMSFPTAEPLYVYLLLGVLVLELLISILFLLVYTVKVMSFNKNKLNPDISQEEQSHAYSSHGHFAGTETGFREGSSLGEIVEKQADLIEYLKQRNALLSKRILSLTSQQIRD